MAESGPNENQMNCQASGSSCPLITETKTVEKDEEAEVKELPRVVI